jgi:predicted RNA binding protein YcfA (HicA-like mRNA interferase family)
MPRLHVLSGLEVIAAPGEFGFHRAMQRGSHVKLQRATPDGRVQTLTIPDHHEIDRGTLQAIYRQALRFIPDSELRPKFYTD